jgi:hypothetical protein
MQSEEKQEVLAKSRAIDSETETNQKQLRGFEELKEKIDSKLLIEFQNKLKSQEKTNRVQ